MIRRILSAVRRPRLRAQRALAAAKLAQAQARRDTRTVHTAAERLKAATTDLLRAEVGRG